MRRLDQIPAERRGQAHYWSSRHTAFPRRWPTAADTRSSSARRAGWLAKASVATTGSWPIKAAAARRQQPWLGPDVGESYVRLRPAVRLATGNVRITAGTPNLVVVPIGFLSDHMEVVYDLDHELAPECKQVGVQLVRAATVGTHPRFVHMIRELIVERMAKQPERLSLGLLGTQSRRMRRRLLPADCASQASAGLTKPAEIAKPRAGGQRTLAAACREFSALVRQFQTSLRRPRFFRSAAVSLSFIELILYLIAIRASSTARSVPKIFIARLR